MRKKIIQNFYFYWGLVPIRWQLSDRILVLQFMQEVALNITYVELFILPKNLPVGVEQAPYRHVMISIMLSVPL